VEQPKFAPEVNMGFSSLLFKCGDYEKALEAARKAVKLSPKDRSARIQLARCLMKFPERVKEAASAAIEEFTAARSPKQP